MRTQAIYAHICSESQLHFAKSLLYFPLYHSFFPFFPLYLPFLTDLQDPSWSSVSQAPRKHLILQTCSSTRLSQRETGAREHPASTVPGPRPLRRCVKLPFAFKATRLFPG